MIKNASIGAFAPATVANVAVGFDVLGFATETIGDRVFIEKNSAREVVIEKISGIPENLPVNVENNTATAGLLHFIEDQKLDFGFRVTIEKGIPMGSGMGGSAASAVAAIVAANSLLDEPLKKADLLPYALIGESKASGSIHADNIVPCLMGGLTIAKVSAAIDGGKIPRVDFVQLPVPDKIFCVLIHPHLVVETKGARSILKKQIDLHLHIQQSTNLALFLSACFLNDLVLLKNAFEDVVIEPQRAHLIPGFLEAQAVAREQGALGCSISGAGPSVFAWAETSSRADVLRKEMVGAFARKGIDTHSWVSPISQKGAYLL